MTVAIVHRRGGRGRDRRRRRAARARAAAGAGRGAGRVRRILLPFTGSAISRRAFEAAVRLARVEDATIMPGLPGHACR